MPGGFCGFCAALVVFFQRLNVWIAKETAQIVVGGKRVYDPSLVRSATDVKKESRFCGLVSHSMAEPIDRDHILVSVFCLLTSAFVYRNVAAQAATPAT
jgi:hypothetical protein